MDNVRDDKNCVEMEEQEQMDVGSIFRCIFSSCDVDHTDLVPVAKLIEFVKPYMFEDLNALEDLRHSLDPERKDVLINSERFYQVMSLWSQKVAATSSNEESEFDRSPSRLQVIDEKELPYTHSTPRASIGDKLLRCKDLLNLSNVSGYSLSTSRLDTTNPADSDKTVLEEEIKKLEHQLSKTANELTITKQQLTASEEQNDTLQQDLDRLNRRLHAEQQVNEHLQKEKVLSEELRDELSTCKKVIEDLKKKLSQSEKDSMYHRDVIDEQDNEKLKLEKKVEVLSKQHQDCLKEIFEVKTEMETKEQQLTDVIKVYDELKLKFAEQKDFNDQLREENDILSHQKSTLEKALKVKSFNSPHSNLGNLNLDLSNTPSPHHNTQNTYSPRYSPSFAHQSGIQPKCHSRPLLRRVLARNSSTPVNLSHSLLDSSLPESVKSVPVLSPVYGAMQEEGDQRQDSSEEDLYWKIQQGGDAKIEGQDLNGTTESLHTEMHRADPILISETYHTSLFEKDEQIIELEEELEKVKSYLKEIEDQKNDLLSRFKEMKKINDQLIDSNFILESKVRESKETSLTKIESLKNRLAQLEKNGVIVENDQENLQGEIEELRNKIQTLEGDLESKKIENKELNSKIEGEVLLKKEVLELKEKLRKSEILIKDHDQRLQAAMKDLGEVSMKKVCIEEQLKTVNKDNAHRKDLEEKLMKVEESYKLISDKNKSLEDENFVLRQDLECSKSKYDHLSNRFAVIEVELCEYKDLNNNKDQELTRSEQEKQKMAYKFEETLRLKDQELKQLKDLQNQINGDLESFKKNLEKKIVGEFEGKVKNSMDAEDNILTLKNKCNQLEVDLKNNLSKLNSKSRSLVETENKIKYLGEHEISLKQEIESLKALNTGLELTVANMKSEQENLQAKLQKINNIDVVAAEVQKHIKDKDVIIEELKRLNKKLEHNLTIAEIDLKEKINEILKLRNEWSKNIDIKNDLWNRLKYLQNENYRINAENRELLEKERQLSNAGEKLNIEFNNLLIVYDVEVNKNSKLNEKIAQFIEEKNQYCNKYDKLNKELSAENEKISSSLLEYQAKLCLLELKNNELRDKLAEVQKNDSTSQTETADSEAFDEQFLKIKLESDKLLEELESKANEEVNKNEVLTKDLFKLKEHLDRSNTELLEMRQKITDNEIEMVATLQQNIENNKKLAEELFRVKETLHTKDVDLDELLKRVNKAEDELKLLNEQNVTLNQELTIKSDELGNMQKKIKDKEAKMQMEVEIKNTELLKKLTDVESLLEQRQTEMRCIENNNRQLVSELNLTKQEKDKINNKLFDATSEILILKDKVCEFQNGIEKKNGQLRDELNRTKQEKDILNNKLEQAYFEISQLREKLSESEKVKGTLKDKLQEAAFEIIQLQTNQSESKKTNETLDHKLQEAASEITQLQDKLSESEKTNYTLNNKMKTAAAEIIQLREKLSESENTNDTLNNKFQAAASEIIREKFSENEKIKSTILNETKQRLQEEIAKNKALFEKFSFLKQERDQLTLELHDTKELLTDTKTLYNKRQVEIKECLAKCSELEEKIVIQTEQFKKSADEINDNNLERSLMNPVTEKETTKGKTYSRQQIVIDKLKDKLEEEKNKNRKLQEQLTAKKEKLEELEKKDEIAMSPVTNEIKGEAAKTVNKFTLAARSPTSPDSPSTDIEVNGLDTSRKLSFHTKYPFTINCDSTIEIPSLDVNGFADDIIEELELNEGSPRKTFDREETEKNVTALTLRLLVNSNDITERIENQTEKYRCQYEEILNLIRDISHRLRDHVCIGTAEPIMPVFVLLEDIKLQLREVVQTAGQVGVLIYEDRMKKCWNLVTNYMATLRQENESLLNISRETTPTQTGLRRRHKFTQDQVDLPEKTLYRRKRISCSRLTGILLFVLGFALTISIIIHLNCRMTASENQYCPLDSIITRINVGIPPM